MRDLLMDFYQISDGLKSSHIVVFSVSPDTTVSWNYTMDQLFSGIIQWIEPPDAVLKAIECGRSESELLDGCRALMSMAAVEEETGVHLNVDDVIDLTAFLEPSTGCKVFPSPGVYQDGRNIAVKRVFFNDKHRAADFYNEGTSFHDVNSKATLMFSVFVSDEIHENIFWPDVYFQVKNNEDVLQALTTKETIVDWIAIQAIMAV
ncbi:exportin-4 isoform X1 [Olea europaea subsp. europaea]|uniref:Exportin-4 isoform X1 n=1 Tax=Olea europaea subsp. europaea TaxID=158383 RepID=A0A8S0SN32_OLEEU|nr:exportin-4 isoform X1 [Olea europaea subsp. europaea]